MLIACHAWAYNNLPLEAALGTIARLGFRHVDLGTGPHLNINRAIAQPQAEARAIRALLDRFGLSLTDFYMMLPHINAPDPIERETELDLFEQLIPFATALGTPGITLSPGLVQSDGPDHSVARSVVALLRILQAVESTDLRVSFEPHMDSVAHTPEAALLLLDAVPGLSLTLDDAHFACQGIGQEALEPLLEHIAHVQVRQAARGRLQTAHADGTIDLARLVQDLHMVGYRGALSVEYMTTFGWHAMQKVNITRETVLTRDALRAARASLEIMPARR
ncbi:sugar phosphate isomerase/epimerase family protein [Aggregatilinea lenta]|uniref:sugar phosphate isomerase/epimerase family protein n=1 Tax=Aggregatilinea lenta TaxID=913108 RepID=UPI000E5A88F0|nr:sugar phosphate isomerase/epimerase [Aggregatilinea lenta]